MSKKSNIGFRGLVLNFGIKLGGVLIKCLKFAKGVKIALAFGSFALWSLVFSWQFALVLMIALAVHESGHVWAMKRCGIRTRGFYFIPLLGGVAVPDDVFRSRWSEFFVAIMGPVWGVLPIPICLAVYYMSHNTLYAGIASWVAMVNLLNLLPIMPLDGGRILRSIALSFSHWVGLVAFGFGLLIAVIVSLKFGFLLLFILFILGAVELFFDVSGLSVWKRLSEKSDILRSIFPKLAGVDIISLMQEVQEDPLSPYVKESDVYDLILRIHQTPIGQLPDLVVNDGAVSILTDSGSAVPLSMSMGSGRGIETEQNVTELAIIHRLEAMVALGLWIWFWRDVKGYYLHTQNFHHVYKHQMSKGRIAIASICYVCALLLLAGLMLYLRHIPGAAEALAIFQS